MLQGYGCGSVPVSIEYPRLAKKILSRCEHSVNLAGPRGFFRRLATILSLFRRFYKIVKLFFLPFLSGLVTGFYCAVPSSGRLMAMASGVMGRSRCQTPVAR